MTKRLIIAGGGLSGVLAATAFVRSRPDVDLTVIEAGPTLGGDHTWSFYQTDLQGEAESLVTPFVRHQWSGYQTRFQDFSRDFSTGYRTVFSADLHRVAMGMLGDRVRLNAPVADLDARGVTLEGGERLEADAVIDARGARRLDGVVLRWQKFLGQEVRLTAPHGLSHPTIMDAVVPQIDGYRFVYLLPYETDTLLIEDTYYSEGPQVDPDILRQRVNDYAAGRGWTIKEVIREEKGALPLLLGGDFNTMWACAAPEGGAVPIGLRAGLFHAVTGYSLPVSARAAVALSSLEGPLTTEHLREAVEKLARKHFAGSKFNRLLNRLLFLAGRPENRHQVLARFHRLPQPLIERFYAGQTPRSDMIRILVGKPPVPFFQAVKVVPESAAMSPR
ncbi:MAG: lycopene beta-cyclase CrtY [Pseudomonadota bacterium]